MQVNFPYCQKKKKNITKVKAIQSYSQDPQKRFQPIFHNSKPFSSLKLITVELTIQPPPNEVKNSKQREKENKIYPQVQTFNTSFVRWFPFIANTSYLVNNRVMLKQCCMQHHTTNHHSVGQKKNLRHSSSSVSQPT